jgi:hypothetical protein
MKTIQELAQDKVIVAGCRAWLEMSKWKRKHRCPFGEDEDDVDIYYCKERCGELFPETICHEGWINECPCYHPLVGPRNVRKMCKAIVEAAA